LRFLGYIRLNGKNNFNEEEVLSLNKKLNNLRDV